MDCKLKNIEVAGFIDSNERMWENTILDIPVHSPEEILSLQQKSKIIIAIVDGNAIKEISKILQNAGLKEKIDFELYTALKITQVEIDRYFSFEKHCQKITNIKTKNEQKMLIFLSDEKIQMAGLCDRLCGITTLYKIAKELNVAFKINWTFPFQLSNFLVPNKYNWELNKKENIYNQYSTFHAFPFCKKTSTIKEMKNKILYSFNKYSKVCSVANYGINYKKEYSSLFRELFKPAPALQAQIDYHLDKIGGSYISAHFRFIALLGDFNEQRFRILEKNEQKKLLKNCIEHLLEIHAKNPNKKIFVATDSITFLNAVKNFDFVYVVEGDISHIANADTKMIDYTKLFLDYFLIANSQKVYKIVDEKMYDGRFALTASFLNNIPHIIRKY